LQDITILYCSLTSEHQNLIYYFLEKIIKEEIMGLFNQMNTESTAEDAVVGEKHAPVITISNLDGNKKKVSINVGGGKHPNQMGHWIQWVELRVNDLYIGRTEFSAEITDPVTEFTVNINQSCTVSAVARCNTHGLWETKVTI
jgi:superoxide reductase